MLKAAPSSGQPQATRGTTGQDRACEQIRVSGSLVRPAHYHNHDCEHPCAYQHSLYVLQCFFAWDPGTSRFQHWHLASFAHLYA